MDGNRERNALIVTRWGSFLVFCFLAFVLPWYVVVTIGLIAVALQFWGPEIIILGALLDVAFIDTSAGFYGLFFSLIFFLFVFLVNTRMMIQKR